MDFCAKIELIQILYYSKTEYFLRKFKVFIKIEFLDKNPDFLIQISVQEKCCVVKVTAHYWFLVPFSFACKLLRKVLCLAFFLIVWRHKYKKTRQNVASQKNHFLLISFWHNFHSCFFPVKIILILHKIFCQNKWVKNLTEFFKDFYLIFIYSKILNSWFLGIKLKDFEKLKASPH